MNLLALLWRKRFEKPIKAIAAVLCIPANQTDVGAVACAKLPVIDELIHIDRGNAMRSLPAGIDMPDFSDAKDSLPAL